MSISAPKPELEPATIPDEESGTQARPAVLPPANDGTDELEPDWNVKTFVGTLFDEEVVAAAEQAESAQVEAYNDEDEEVTIPLFELPDLYELPDRFVEGVEGHDHDLPQNFGAGRDDSADE